MGDLCARSGRPSPMNALSSHLIRLLSTQRVASGTGGQKTRQTNHPIHLASSHTLHFTLFLRHLLLLLLLLLPFLHPPSPLAVHSPHSLPSHPPTAAHSASRCHQSCALQDCLVGRSFLCSASNLTVLEARFLLSRLGKAWSDARVQRSHLFATCSTQLWAIWPSEALLGSGAHRAAAPGQVRGFNVASVATGPSSFLLRPPPALFPPSTSPPSRSSSSSPSSLSQCRWTYVSRVTCLISTAHPPTPVTAQRSARAIRGLQTRVCTCASRASSSSRSGILGPQSRSCQTF